MGVSARSVLAHQGLVCLSELLHFCPGAMAASKGGCLVSAADTLLGSTKKNQPKVLRERVDTIFQASPPPSF